MPQEHVIVVDAEGTDCRDCMEDDFSQRLALKREDERLKTFAGWSKDFPVKAEDLARDGFYYLNVLDHVKCIFCNLILKNWEKGDNVQTEHKKYNSTCPFLLNRNVGNVPIRTLVPGTSTGRETARPVPKYPEYSKPAAREGSFRNHEHIFTQSVDSMVEAGFFYTDIDDSVRCFHCGIVVRNWEPGDNPWSEHEHWSPNCYFLQTHPRTDDDEVFEFTPVMKRVVGMGYDRKLVEAAVRRRIKSGGSMITDINELVEYVENVHIQQETVSRAHGVTRETGAAGSSLGTPTVQTAGASSSLESEYQQLKDQRLCKICMEREVEVTFVPCGHFIACENCGAPLKKCPICRKIIRSYVKTFMS